MVAAARAGGARRVVRGAAIAAVSGVLLMGGLPLGVTGASADTTPVAGATPAAPVAGATPTAPATGATPTAVATAGATATSGATPTVGPTAVAGSDAARDAFRDHEDQLALLLGRARVAAGLPPLARSQALDRAAVAHARDMAAVGYMDHDAPDGSTPASRAASEGYETPAGSAWLVVEVISARGDDPSAPLDWWLGDDVHRRVVLGTRWREFGVGYAPGGPYGRFWVVDVGCRPGILPPVLLDGELTIPDEQCDQSGAAFGPLQSVRFAETSAAAHALDWVPYAGQQPWAAGHQAVVDLRDTAGRELEMHATDPTGALAETP